MVHHTITQGLREKPRRRRTTSTSIRADWSTSSTATPGSTCRSWAV